MNARAYTPDDFEMIRGWAENRGLTLIPEFVGKTGFIVEDVKGPCAVAMVYLMFDVPVAVIDNFITRPGLLGRQVVKSWHSLWRMISAYLRGLQSADGGPLSYPIVRTFVGEKLAPIIQREGWRVSEGALKEIIYAL